MHMHAPSPLRPLLCTAALLLWGLVPLGVSSGWPSRLHATLRNDALNARDHERIEHGYYERLIEATPPRPGTLFDAGALARNVDDVREYVLKSNLQTTHKGASWTTNALGLRDRPYPEARPPGTRRVALIGDSIAAGWGVDDGLGFEPAVERIWNDRSIRAGGPAIEVLNFAVPGHAPGQRWEHFRRVGWSTSPDLVIFEGTLADLGWDERRLRSLLARGVGFDAPVYQQTLIDGGITPSDDLKARLRPLRAAILAGVYRRVVTDCRTHGVPAVWVLLPRVGKPVNPEDRGTLISLARSAGFDRVVDLTDTFDGRPAASLAIAPDDFHPNVAGHALLAQRLDTELSAFVSSTTRPSRPEVEGTSLAHGRPDRAPRARTSPPTTEGVAPR
jgi:lysophospholipase L1-like esterase